MRSFIVGVVVASFFTPVSEARARETVLFPAPSGWVLYDQGESLAWFPYAGGYTPLQTGPVWAADSTDSGRVVCVLRGPLGSGPECRNMWTGGSWQLPAPAGAPPVDLAVGENSPVVLLNDGTVRERSGGGWVNPLPPSSDPVLRAAVGAYADRFCVAEVLEVSSSLYEVQVRCADFGGGGAVSIIPVETLSTPPGMLETVVTDDAVCVQTGLTATKCFEIATRVEYLLRSGPFVVYPDLATATVWGNQVAWVAESGPGPGPSPTYYWTPLAMDLALPGTVVAIPWRGLQYTEEVALGYTPLGDLYSASARGGALLPFQER